MKKLLLASLLAVCGVAMAEPEPVMSIRNGVGGDIILTLRQHPTCGENRRAVATEPDKMGEDGNPIWIYHWGCWTYFEGVIYVQWDEGQRSQLKAGSFEANNLELPNETEK